MHDLKLGNIALIYWMIDSFIQGFASVDQIAHAQCLSNAIDSHAKSATIKLQISGWKVNVVSFTLSRIWNFDLKSMKFWIWIFYTIHCGFIQLCFGNDFLLVTFLLITNYLSKSCHCIFFISATVIPNIYINIYLQILCILIW